MSQENEKRELRELKRDLKRAGNKRLRRLSKEALDVNPKEAIDIEPDYGRLSTAEMNGMDRKAKKLKSTDAGH